MAPRAGILARSEKRFNPWPGSGKDRDGIPLSLEDRLLDVPEILTVGVQGEWDVAADLDPVEVVLAEETAILGATAENTSRHRGQIRRRNLDRSDEIEASVEGCLARDGQRQSARVRVWAAVRYECSRRPPVTFDLELRLDPASALRELAHDRPREREIAWPSPVAVPAKSVHPAHDVRR
jgi:hypothetical protein